MANTVSLRTFVMTSADANHNKVWKIEQFDDGSYKTYNGRIGTGVDGKPYPLAENNLKHDGKAESLIASKLKKGYEELDIIQDASGQAITKTASVNGFDLEQVAVNQIETQSKEVLDLVRWFARENIHQIISQSKIQYNAQSGLFETPLGVVGMGVVRDARNLLVDIGDLVSKDDFGEDFKHQVERYCMKIPQNIGRKKLNPRDIFNGLQDVQKQNDILDSLEGSIRMIMSGGGGNAADQAEQADMEQVFNTRIDLITDPLEIKRITDKYMRTLQSMHACAHLRPKRIFEIEIREVKNAWDGDGSKMSNISEYWHGTKIGNILSILKGGLIIPPYDSRYCAGRMFGNGVYFSSESSKSLNYAYGYWSGTRNDHCFMFLADVAMGEAYTPTGPSQSLPKPGYDSTFAKANVSGVRNHEMIVYRTSQANLTRLIEFTPQGR